VSKILTTATSSFGHLILTRGATFEGRLNFTGTARLCGVFKGEVVGSGLLIIESEAHVEAQVQADEVVVKGWVRGEISATRMVSLLEGSEFYGAMSAPNFSVEEGALFEGAVVKST